MKVKVGLRGAMAEPNAPPLREPTLGELRTAFLTQADYNIRQTTNARATMADALTSFHAKPSASVTNTCRTGSSSSAARPP